MGDAAAHAVLTLARSKSGLFEDGSRQANPQSRKTAKAGFAYQGHTAIR